jgi:hypothetical protein
MMGVPMLLDMLTYKRPAGSRSERDFIRQFIAPTGAVPDRFGNYVLRIGTAPVAWCSHTDTVHRSDGRQRLRVSKGIVRRRKEAAPALVPLPGKKGSWRWTYGECLGADDTTGVWLMLEMIRAGVEGLYIFHRAEEQGCQGSNFIARNTPDLLDGIDFAIAFDRRGTDSIVTHQMGIRTCSDEFAWTLSDALGLNMLPDDSGVFTDTEVYADIVPECTNISVGYERQHSAEERQCLTFAAQLRDALLRMDLSRLVVERTPGYDPEGDDLFARWYTPEGALVVTTPDSCGCSECEREAYHKCTGVPSEECALCGEPVDLRYIFAGEEVCEDCFEVIMSEH